jgi:hypothetical protein
MVVAVVGLIALALVVLFLQAASGRITQPVWWRRW